MYNERIASETDARDWFYFELGETRQIEAWLVNIPQDCDYALYLVHRDGPTVAISDEYGNRDEHIPRWALPAGRHYLVVVRQVGWSSTVPYSLRMSLGPYALWLPAILKGVAGGQ